MCFAISHSVFLYIVFCKFTNQKWILPKSIVANHEDEEKVNVVRAKSAKQSTSDAYGVRDHLGGQMLVFSFHVMGLEEVRCYMFYCGKCVRFYPNDIFHLIPELFVDSKAVRNDFYKRYSDIHDTFQRNFDRFKKILHDKLFDQFYAGLVNGESADIPTEVKSFKETEDTKEQ